MKNILIVFLLIIFLAGCKQAITPRPKGYFRIDLPEKEYRMYDSVCPYKFEIPLYARISYDLDGQSEPCWLNIEFPGNMAKLYISYKSIDGNLTELMDDTHDLTYKHSIKADAIYESAWVNADEKVYGIVYDVKGNSASALQFFATDSTKHFLRGSLYFMSSPNEDSIAPVLSYLRRDIVHLLETLSWK